MNARGDQKLRQKQEHSMIGQKLVKSCWTFTINLNPDIVIYKSYFFNCSKFNLSYLMYSIELHVFAGYLGDKNI